MIPVSSYKGKKIALFGLGISGLSAAAALKAGGADVVCYDENAGRCEEAKSRGLTVLNLQELSDEEWGRFAALLLSPGVPLTHPEPHWSVKRASAAKVPVIGDTELFFQDFLLRGQNDRVIVITGTNGKSTTTALTTHILNEAGETAVMGGNIGFGVLDMPDFGSRNEEGGTVYVLELSSYQIDLTPSLCPTAAGLLNITPDHIDRHGTVEHYAEVKGRIFNQLGLIGAGFSDGRAVISLDDKYCCQIATNIPERAEICLVSSDKDDVFASGIGALLADTGFELICSGKPRKIDLSEVVYLRGRHNAQNAAFALLLAMKVCGNVDGLIEGLKSFPGLKHRMQQVGELVRDELRLVFVNDSKATNADASEQALKSYPVIFWIAGGRAKAGGIKSLAGAMSGVKKAFLIGEAGEDFAETLKGLNIPFEICGDMENAVSKAISSGFEILKSMDGGKGEGAVLLSPAAASFDQYPNFEVRGDDFCSKVRLVEGVKMNEELS